MRKPESLASKLTANSVDFQKVGTPAQGGPPPENPAAYLSGISDASFGFVKRVYLGETISNREQGVIYEHVVSAVWPRWTLLSMRGIDHETHTQRIADNVSAVKRLADIAINEHVSNPAIPQQWRANQIGIGINSWLDNYQDKYEIVFSAIDGLDREFRRNVNANQLDPAEIAA